MNAMTNIQTIESLNADIAGRERALAPVIAQRDALDARIGAESEAIRALIDQRATLQLSEMGAAPDWALLLSTDSAPAQKRLDAEFKAMPFRRDGAIWEETGQVKIDFALTAGRLGEVVRAAQFARHVLPFVAAHQDGGKRFGILEHNFNAYAVYYAIVYEDTNEYVVTTSRGQRLFVGETLESWVQYIHDELYFEVARELSAAA
jgi:hypothetical protein